LACSKTKPKTQYLQGNVFGTTFHISYVSNDPLNCEKQVDSLFHLLNKSLSTYIQTSDISRINNNDTDVVVDTFFLEVYDKSKRIYKESNGVFDPTIGILVNAWGFGPGKVVENLDSTKVEELLQYVGFDKVVIQDGKLKKEHPNMYFDFNAIAKGYGVDVIGRYLESASVNNYLVEIGGELRARGTNAMGNLWRIGIEKPNFDGTRGIQKILSLENKSLATSGNYRKFKVNPKTGEKFVHTIDSKTGFTARRDLLSATVIADMDCADVDGYATTFMAMGYEGTLQFLEKHPELKVFLIVSDEQGEFTEYTSEGL
jgi:thiamine biosynthesis lipoprotein